jgi:Helix-turn-helix domain
MEQKKPLNFAQALRSRPREQTDERPQLTAVDGPSTEDRPSNTDSPSNVTSPSISDGLSLGQPPPPPVDSPSIPDSPTKEDSPSKEDILDLLKTIPHVAGHTALPHTFSDHLARWLSSDEQAVYLQLYRLSWGWNKSTCFISNPRLSERSGVPETSMRRAIRKLVSKKLIEKTNRVFGSQIDQGIEYRVFKLDSLARGDRASNMDSLSNVAPNKEKLLKETDQKDFSKCLDCMGTGFYYPEGTAKGVRRCEHKRL